MSTVRTRDVRLASVLLALVATVLTGPVFGSDGLLPPLSADAIPFGEGGLLLLWGLGHCDTLDGPVVMFARKALETGNANLVLPWVRREDEAEIRRVFDHALAVRKLGPEARALADAHFFETLVRIHRTGEGAPYTGLKPAGLDRGPAVPAADKALETGSVEALIKLLTDAVRGGINRHFYETYQQRTFDVNDVALGRKYVEAYVSYVHYVEGLWEVAQGSASAHHATHGQDRGHEHH